MAESPVPTEYPNQLLGVSGASDTNVGSLNLLNSPLRLSNAAGSVGTSMQSGTGVPTVGGNAGDLYFRYDTPSSSNQRIYVCTVAGLAGAATWVGIL